MTSILVTGGAGYIGSHTALALREAGHKVVILDNLDTGHNTLLPDGAVFAKGNVGDQDLCRTLIKEHGIDTVLHFAASIRVDESMTDPVKYYRNNTVNTLALADACAGAGVKTFIFSSTAAVYGMPRTGVAAESDETLPINPYGNSKLASEKILTDIAAASGMKLGMLRYFNVAGADPELRCGQIADRATHLIKVACEVATGKRAQMAIYGTDYDTPDGTCVRDYIHVSDLAQAHLDVLRWVNENGKNLTVNCGYGHGYSVREIIMGLEKILGRTLPVIEEGRRAGDPPMLIANADKIRSVTGWQPRHDSIETILRTALAWEEKIAA